MNWKSTLITLAVSTFLCTSCSPDENLNGIPVMGEPSMRAPSPQLSTPCGPAESFSLTQTNGNYYVDDCGLVPCASNTIPWGDIEIETFSLEGNTFLGIEGESTSGWSFTDYDVFVSSTQEPTFDANQVPIVDGNWIRREINGVEQQFREDVQIQPAAFMNYNISVRASMYRLDFFGGYDSNSLKELWISYRPNTVSSRKKFVIKYLPPSCNSMGNRIAYQD